MEITPSGIEQVFSDMGADYLESAVDDDPGGYIRKLYRSTIVASRAGNVARVVTNAMIVDDGQIPDISGHFLKGELLGLDVVGHFIGTHHRVLIALYDDLPQPVRQPEPDNLPKITAQGMADMAHSGWRRAESHYGRLFTYWDSELCDEPVHRPYLRYGFGLILAAALNRQQIIENVADKALAEVDLDAELDNLLQKPND